VTVLWVVAVLVVTALVVRWRKILATPGEVEIVMFSLAGKS
jgi:hypothetical protein